MDPSTPEDYHDDHIASDAEASEDDQHLEHGSALESPAGTGGGQTDTSGKTSGHLQKRRRVTRACDECRRKKIKCDGKQPSPQYVENLERRVHRAETLLHILIPNLDLSDPGIDAAVAQGWIPGAPGKGNPAAAQPRTAQPSTSVNGTDNLKKQADTNLESMVRAVAQLDVDEQGHWDYHGHSSGLSFVRRMREQLGDLMGPDTPAMPFVKTRPMSQVLDSPKSLADSPNPDMSPSVSDLPPKDVASEACGHALVDAAALLRVVHVPSFWQSFEHLYSTPPEQWSHEDHTFLPLFYSAMALGHMFGRDEHSSLNRHGYEPAIQQGFAHFKTARHMMDIADCRDLTSIQAVIFMILFLQCSAKLSQCYAYLGVALRSALRMGLHRAHAGDFNPIESQIRKRVFWAVQKLDIYVGAMLGLPQTLSDEDVDQEFPMEIDDEYITRDGILPRPNGELSLMTAFNTHTRLVLILRKIVRTVYPIKVKNQPQDKSYSVPFSAIREIEGEMEAWKNDLPPSLSPGVGPARFSRVQQLLRLSYAHAQVMLYRPFLHFVASEKRMQPMDGRAYACAMSYVNVSRNIIHITTQMKQKGLLNGAFWFICYTSFFSVLSMVYFAAENPDNPTTQAVLKDALEGKQVLASLAKGSLAADRCTATLDAVFQRLPSWMQEGSANPQMTRKRHHDADLHAVKAAAIPQASKSHTDVADCKPNMSTTTLQQRAASFPRHNGQLAMGGDPNIKPSYESSPWSHSGASTFGTGTPTSNGFEPAPMGVPFQNGNQAVLGMPSYPQASNYIPDFSTMMFPPADEPFQYPGQPLTAFENNQQFAMNPSFNGLGPGHTMVPPSSRSQDDNIEAQFFALPPYIEQKQNQNQQMGFNEIPYGNRPAMGPIQMPNGMANASSMPQDMGSINIQEIFGGNEWNSMLMNPADNYRISSSSARSPPSLNDVLPALAPTSPAWGTSNRDPNSNSLSNTWSSAYCTSGRQSLNRASAPMAKKSSWNPLAFVPTQVTFIISAVYIALFAILVWTHLTVPPAADKPSPDTGLNLTQAWRDLEFLSSAFHPINSRQNEVVRQYLLHRIHEITATSDSSVTQQAKGAPITVFTDNTSNVTFTDTWRGLPHTCYGESENVLVYVRGKEDEEGEWWTTGKKYEGPAGVLVNAHYDSVPSGYGATDDGVGVVTILQMLAYFSAPGNQPRRGIVLLLNSGEENGLYGARNYMRHPISQFPHVFLNLEGAGAGGRAMLFRSTDAEVTKFYARSPYPFGSVVSGDGFKRGAIRSGTDYSIFTEVLGLRGLDVAFYEPRARYHTDEDSARETSPASLWHMLSASLATVKGLAIYKGDDFEGAQDRAGRINTGRGNDAVWFDMFGRALAVMKLTTLFALSVTLLVAAPIILIVLEVIIARNGKWYPLSFKAYLHNADDDEPVQLGGFKGFFRFPFAFIISTVVTGALAFLVTKINPFIAYSSPFTVWAMMLTAWFSIAWFFLAGADRVRPTALQRMFVLLWTYAVSWIALVAATVGENNLHLGGGYFLVIFNFTVWLALLISYFELIALPTKTRYVEDVYGAEQDAASIRPGSQSSRTLLSQSRERPRSMRSEREPTTLEDDEVTENTSLLRGSDNRSQHTFSGRGKRPHLETDDPFLKKVYGDEQAWSSSLPSWIWIAQFLLLAPINIIIIGQVALMITSALHQTPADGNSPMTIYLLIAGLTLLLLLPLAPFLHRFTYQIPTLLFLVFIGCLVYNLLAFPFSRDARMKHYFVQTVDLDTGMNNVTLRGIDGYIQDIIAELPSASGQPIHCGISTSDVLKQGLQTCSWHGLAPQVVPNPQVDVEKSKKKHRNETSPSPPPPSHSYADWLHYNTSTPSNVSSTATLTFRGSNSKACYLTFSRPVTSVNIADAAADPRFETVAENGSERITLFSRTWEKTFNVTVGWEGRVARGEKGRVTCLWSDVNQDGVIPAWDEVKKFEPVWAAATKATDGLVEGYKEFVI
nr:vacuolar membrane protease [Quercus suber]